MATPVHDEKTSLVSAGQWSGPVDHLAVEQQTQRRRKLCFSVAVACGLGLALCLAIALPLTLQGSGAGQATVDNGQPDPGIMLMALGQFGNNESVPPGQNSSTRDLLILNTTARPLLGQHHETEDSSGSTSGHTFTKSEATATTSRHRHFPFTFPTFHTRSSTTRPPRTTTHRPDWLLPTCPLVSASVRGAVDMSRVADDKPWYESYRIQSYNSPAYTDRVTCSQMTLNMTSEAEAVMKLDWSEDRQWRRDRKTFTIRLHRNDTSSLDWLETYNGGRGQISFLAELGGHLLVYECFPDADYYPKPGYVIRTYSRSAWPDGTRVDEALLALASLWGLNPAEMYPIRIRHLCD